MAQPITHSLHSPPTTPLMERAMMDSIRNTRTFLSHSTCISTSPHPPTESLARLLGVQVPVLQGRHGREFWPRGFRSVILEQGPHRLAIHNNKYYHLGLSHARTRTSLEGTSLRGYLGHKKLPSPPQDHRRALGLGLR